MREIKFRAWNKKLKLMSEPWDLFEGFDGRCMYACYVNEEQYLWYPEEVKLMQFTGLKDKNGKEIYEGDIVIHPIYIVNSKLNTRQEIKAKWGIDFRTGSFYLYPIGVVTGGGDGDVPLWNQPEDNEIIGNKFENPDLITD